MKAKAVLNNITDIICGNIDLLFPSKGNQA